MKTASTSTGWIGRPIRRFEDERFLGGTARYVADLSVPGMAHLLIVRSPYAHAHLRSIDVDAARRSPGVIAVITARDLEGRVTPMSLDARDGASVEPVPHPLLTADKARYVGDSVAAILAETRPTALGASERVRVDYEPLPAVVDAREALRGNVLVHDHIPGNVLVRWRRASGDVAGAFSSAARVVTGRFHIPRLVAAPLEGRGTLAVYDRGTDHLTVWTSNQSAHGPRAGLARILQRHEETIRVIVPDVGGGFGAKGAWHRRPRWPRSWPSRPGVRSGGLRAGPKTSWHRIRGAAWTWTSSSLSARTAESWAREARSSAISAHTLHPPSSFCPSPSQCWPPACTMSAPRSSRCWALPRTRPGPVRIAARVGPRRRSSPSA